MLLQKVSQTNTCILFVGAGEHGFMGGMPTSIWLESAGVTGELWASSLWLMNLPGSSCSHWRPSVESLCRHTHDPFTSLSHSQSENMSCLQLQAQEKKQHGGSRAGFRKHPYLRMTWYKNDLLSREWAERQRESEKQAFMKLKGRRQRIGSVRYGSTCITEATDDILNPGQISLHAASVITGRPEEILDDWYYLFLIL